MNERLNNIHRRALVIAKQFRKSETDLISILQEVRKHKVHQKLGYANLFDYCNRALGLSRDLTYTYSKIAEKSEKVPELKQAIIQGKVSTTNARKIAPLINRENKDTLLKKASSLSQRALDKELVKIAPRKVLPDKIRPVNGDTSELRCSLPSESDEWIKRAKDILSQKTRKPCDTGDAIFAAIKEYVQRHDPIEKANRALRRRDVPKKPSKKVVVALPPKRPTIPAKTIHQLMLSDNNQCSHINENNHRCTNKRWLDIHHKTPFSQNGTHDLSNLTLLCQVHHKMVHDYTLP